MHEFPVVQNLLRAALAAPPPGVRLAQVRVLLGEAAGFEAGHLEETFARLAVGTPAEGARLEFVREALAARCAQCGADFPSSSTMLACPHCGSQQLTFTAGQQVKFLTAIPAAPTAL